MNGALLLSLLQNAAMLLAMVVVCTVISSRYGTRSGRRLADDRALQVLTGLMMGLIAIAIILTPVAYSQNIILDTRSILISLTALFFGPVPAVVTMTVAALFRLYMGGAAVLTGVLVIASSGLIGLLWRHMRKPRLEQLSLFELYLFGVAVHVAMVGFMLTLPRVMQGSVLTDTALPILLIFPPATVVVGSLVARFLREESLAHAVQASEQRLRMALTASGQELFELNLQTGAMLSISLEENAKRYPQTRFHDSIHTLLDDLHPDDAANVSALLKELAAGTLTQWQGEVRQRTLDGGYLWFYAAARLVSRDSQGRPLHMLGTYLDISARKQDEEALKLAALVYENSHEAMMVTDADTNIIDVNPAFTMITGFGKSEVLGKKPGLLHSGRQTPEFYKAMWDTLNANGHWAGEIWNKRKGGQVFPEWLEINAVRDAEGKVWRWVAQFSDASEKKSAEHQIWHQANYDTLTGLPNRSMFHDRLEQEIKRAHRGGVKLALLFLDLDRFKEVNDSLGHDMGDLLLRQVSGRLTGCVRESDTIARLGGDEFIIILSDLDDTALVGDIAQKIIDKLAAPFMLRANPVYVSASAGITLYPEDGETAEVLMKNIDQAMAMAKKEGRNRYYYFTSAMQEQANRRTRIISDMRQGLAMDQFFVVYQPVVDMHTGRMIKAEALVRWHHPVDGLISPAAFIPVAEESGLIVPLGNQVFREAIQMARQFTAVQPGFMVSINKSPAQFDTKDHAWRELLKDSGLEGSSLVVEITEGLLLDASPSVQVQLQALRNAGLKVALDDFGTGYSSLAYLKKFDISYLKIDQSFVRNLARGNQDHALCDAMITMAHRLGILVIAEGVETAAQRGLLLDMGCDYGQGYLFARPLDGKTLLSMLVAQQAGAQGDSAPESATSASGAQGRVRPSAPPP